MCASFISQLINGQQSPFSYYHLSLKFLSAFFHLWFSRILGGLKAARRRAGLLSEPHGEGTNTPLFSLTSPPLSFAWSCSSANQRLAFLSTCQSLFPASLCHLQFLLRQGLLATVPQKSEANFSPIRLGSHKSETSRLLLAPIQLCSMMFASMEPARQPRKPSSGARGTRSFFPLTTQLLSDRFPPSWGSTSGGQRRPPGDRGKSGGGHLTPTNLDGEPPSSEKVAWTEGRGKAVPFRGLLMTYGETAQQSFRRSDGRSRRQMFPTYVEN